MKLEVQTTSQLYSSGCLTNSMSTDYYDRLGIPINATEEDIRSAFRKAARRLHPDVNVDAGATEMFLGIKEAYEALIDPNKRSSYDKQDQQLPVQTNIEFSRDKLSWLTEEQLVYTLIEMDILADQLKTKKKETPINVALVLDTSTSMRGTRLNMVKSSAIELIQQLKPQDIFSIISFNDRADTVLPAATNIDRHKSESRIRMMQAKGGTEIFQGINAGLYEVRRNLSPYYINHIILITDGHTYGDESNCLELAQKSSELNIGLSCVGIGDEWNDVFLDQLATSTGGSSIYIKDPGELRTFLKQKFQDLGQAKAKDITLNLRMGSGVALNYAYRLQPDPDNLPTSSPIKLGNIPQGYHLRILLEFLLSPITPSIKKVLLADGHISFTIPSQGESPYRIPLTLLRETSANAQPTPPPRIILEAMSRLTLYRMQEQAQKALEAGDYQEAKNRFQNMATNLYSLGEPDLAKTALKEAKNIQKSQKLSLEGHKRIKYGTRALISPKTQNKR